MACPCNIVGLLQSNYPGIFSASLNGSTTIEVSNDTGLVLVGPTISNLNISAYAYLPGQDQFLGATCAASAEASLPWITKYDCFNDQTYFIPTVGSRASITNGPINGVSLHCTPGIISRSFNADASSGPASPFISALREDGFGLVYTGLPIEVDTSVPKIYEIQLGFLGVIRAFLQNFSVSVNPPDPARVQYSFVFAGAIT